MCRIMALVIFVLQDFGLRSAYEVACKASIMVPKGEVTDSSCLDKFGPWHTLPKVGISLWEAVPKCVVDELHLSS